MRKRKTPEEQAQTPRGKGRKTQTPQPVVIDQLLTITQAAARLGLGRTKVYDLINNNLWPYVEIPGVGESTKRISALTLNTWIKNRETVKHASYR
jgi:excisionase family DNA binding protein